MELRINYSTFQGWWESTLRPTDAKIHCQYAWEARGMTAEADARRAAREAAIATAEKVSIGGVIHPTNMKWIDANYPPVAEVKE